MKSKDNNLNSKTLALAALNKRHDHVFKPSDKGVNFVVMDREYYTAMISRLLSDGDKYEVLTINPTSPFLSELKELLLEASP